MIIDSHIVVGQGRYHNADPEAMIEQMDSCGIDRAMLSPVDHELAVDNRSGNERVMALAKKHPQHFLAYATANPWYGKRAEVELDRALQEGAAAVKLHPPLQGFMILEQLVHPLIEVARKYRAPVYIHTGTPAYALPLQLTELALAFSDVSFIMGKNGKSDFWLDAIPAMQGAENIFGDTAHDFPERGMANMIRQFGAERLIFSSNHPVARMPLEHEKVTALSLSNEEKQRILGGNMKRLLDNRFLGETWS